MTFVFYFSDEYAAAGSTVCQQCPAGSECTAGGAASCSAGYYSAAGGKCEHQLVSFLFF